METKRPARKRSRKRLATRLHRWTGIASLAIVLVIAVTGVLLNHTESLNLNERRVTSAPVLRHYGIEPEGEPVIFRSEEIVLGAWDGQLMFDEVVVAEAADDARLIGAGKVTNGEFAFVFPALIVVCDETGGLLDQLDEASLPPGLIRKASARGDTLIVAMDSGERFRLEDWIETVPDPDPEPGWWAPAQKVSGAERETLARAIRGEGLPLSRIVTDLHSGRFFGTIGVILYDLAAILLVVLGITGVLLWFRRR